MMNCPKCNGSLKGVDTLGMFAFEKRSLRMVWLVFACFLVFVWSGLIVILSPESLRSTALIVYYMLGGFFVYKIYNKNLNKVIYECSGCQLRFKGPDLTGFNYKGWSKNEYNKSFKKDAQ